MNLLQAIPKLHIDLAEGLDYDFDMTVLGSSFAEMCLSLASTGHFCLFVAADEIEGERICRELEAVCGGKVPLIVGREEPLMFVRSSRILTYRRLAALAELPEAKHAVVTAEALLYAFPDAKRFRAHVLRFSKDADYDYAHLAALLAEAGYRREGTCENEASFSLRGDILDVWPAGAENPVRLEFFGDTLTEIRVFDPESGKSVRALEEVSVTPATDIFASREELAAALSGFKRDIDAADLEPGAFVKLKNIYNELARLVEAGSSDPVLEYLQPWLERGSISAFLGQDSLVVLCESKHIADRLKNLYGEFYARLDNFVLCGGNVAAHRRVFPEPEEVFDFDEFRKISFQSISTTDPLILPKKILNRKSVPAPQYKNNLPEFVGDVRNWILNGYRVVVACGEQTKEVYYHLSNLGAAFDDPNSPVLLLNDDLPEGFLSHEKKLALFGKKDLFRSAKKKQLKKSRKEIFSGANVGDYVVHELHGIGRCKGICRLSGEFSDKEYLSVEFRDGDTLYVPCDQMDVLSKYNGDDVPKLNKLGGAEFSRLKERVRKSVHAMAIDLKDLYAERESKKGFVFSPDGELQKEFEDEFEFEETPDQITSILEIKRDMESGKIMDRLLCGDVGYGKTEVALRAAFKAVVDGKQVAFLSPTTLLSEQHYKLIKKRFEHFGVRVAKLNRFSAPAETRAVLEGLAQGKVDVVSGTHRLLSADVKFSDLGLLVLDEEQRFGVAHKEKLKDFKRDVDVLTLSATPIPRTLHMSLSGIRDISILSTPPKERLPVQTFVTEYSDELLRDAVMREIARGGQAFILYNEVSTIYKFASHVKDFLPDAELVVAHGQMNETSFEENIRKFYDGEANVLVCTTIIENGIDIKNANTMLVYDADRFGLAQLYQLRGRVGRSNRLAHVYFCYQADKVLTETAYKRLEAIMQFTEFGSGFKIAMKDLEIRGAGDVLGAEQHGHISKIGYDLYCKILKEEVERLSGAETRKNVEIDIDAEAFIPETYIAESGTRISVYQNISNISKLSDCDEMLDDLLDVYGKPPASVLNLFTIAKIKLLAGEIGANAVKVKNKGAGIFFPDTAVLANERVVAALGEFPRDAVLSPSDKPVILFRTKDRRLSAVFDLIYEFLVKCTK